MANVQICRYYPREEFIPYHMRRNRFAAMVCHRRAGKTVATIADMIDYAVHCRKPEPRFAYIAPLFVQAKDIAWNYLKKYTADLECEYNEAELRADLKHNGARIRLYGADNYERLRGVYLDGCVLDEYGDMFPQTWSEVIRPALSDRKGWATFIGTPKGRNDFYDLVEAAKNDPEWFYMCLKASETNLIEPAELASAKKAMSPEMYDQEFMCSFTAALVGAYYGKEMATAEAEERICNVPYDPALPVYTAWDLGGDDSTAIWFAQVKYQEVRIIDYYENNWDEGGECGIDHYAAVLKEKGYNYADHYLPHDAKVREFSTGKSRLETFASQGIDGTVIPLTPLEDGINAVRLLLPRCYIDKRNCAKGIECLRQYRRDFDDRLKVFRNKPRHDAWSHGADAFRYLALGLPENSRQSHGPSRRAPSWLSA